MSEHVVDVRWARGDFDFSYKTYSRDHTWEFDNGVVLAASATPTYRGSAACVDPEEALVASLSSCHMLTFLAIASLAGHVVDSYEDHAVGHLEKNERGKLAITRVELHPRVAFAGATPDDQTLDHLHHQAHEECFIANSVLTEIVVLPAV